MKTWLKWLAECGFRFTVEHKEEDECRVYDFGHGITVYKWERKNGGLVYINNYMVSCGSVKQLAHVITEAVEDAEIQAIIEAKKAQEVEVEEVEVETVEEAVAAVEVADQEVEAVLAQAEQQINETEAQLDKLAIQVSIKIVLDAMNKTLDSNEWELLHQEYLNLKRKLAKFEGGD